MPYGCATFNDKLGTMCCGGGLGGIVGWGGFLCPGSGDDDVACLMMMLMVVIGCCVIDINDYFWACCEGI